MARRLIITAGWFAAAVLAVLVGLVAISVIGDGLTSPLATAMTEEQVARELAAQPSGSPAPSTTLSTTAALPGPRSFSTRGGSVVVRCEGGHAVLVSMAPAQGFAVHERDEGPQDDGAEGEFRSTTDHHDRVKVEATCTAGLPELSARDERDDD